MKKIFGFILLFFISLIIIGCGTNYGYPSKVTFGNSGGTKTCQGDDACYGFDISDYNGNIYGRSNIDLEGKDTMIVTYDWLTVKYKRGDCHFKIIALPNTTGKKRTLYVAGWIENSFAHIAVIQQR